MSDHALTFFVVIPLGLIAWTLCVLIFATVLGVLVKAAAATKKDKP